jgi:CMP-N-acetylneuraminic acid synthetase
MKVIVPAKSSSKRVLNKNWREFHGGCSLVDIQIKKLIDAGIHKSDIIVTCEDTQLLSSCNQRHGVESLYRSPELCANETHVTDVIRKITSMVGNEEEVGWAHVCSPTFNEYAECLCKWEQSRGRFDSLCVAYKSDHFVMMGQPSNLAPVGWSFGNCHTISQNTDTLYTMPFAFSILTRKSLEETSFYVGRNCLWHIASDKHIDIDTEQDFRDAQAVYLARGMGKGDKEPKSSVE